MNHYPGHILCLHICALTTAIMLLACPGICHDGELLRLIETAQERYELRDLDSAIVLGTEALALAEQSSIPVDTLTEQVTKRLGLYHSETGDYQTGIELWQRVLTSREKRLGADHPDVAIVCHGIGNLYYWSGDYVQAERFYRQAMTIRENHYGTYHFTVAANICNLANLAFERGDYAEAERLQMRGLEIRKVVLEPGDREFAKSYSNLGDIATKRGDFATAAESYHQALEILKSTRGESSFPYTSCLTRIGIACREMGQYEAADTLFRKAIETTWVIFDGPNHKIADMVHELAVMSWKSGAIDSARQQFTRAIGIRDKTGAGDTPGQARSWESLSKLFLAEGKHRRACEAAASAVRIRHENFMVNGKMLPERQALIYSSLLRHSVSNYIRIGMKSNDLDSDLQSRLADAIVATKGQVSDVMFGHHTSLSGTSDTVLLNLADTVERLRRKASRLYVQGPRDDPPKHARTLDSLLSLFRETESELLRKDYFAGHSVITQRDVSCKTVAEQLPYGTVLIEYYRTARVAEDLSDNYYVVLLSAEKPPAILDLGPASMIDSLMYVYRDHMGGLSETEPMASEADLKMYGKISATLYELVWRPVDEFSRRANQVLISPDGTLNLLSFAGLKCSDGSYLVERAPLHYLSAGRDILRFRKESPHTSGLLAMGDPDYNSAGPPLVAMTSEDAGPMPGKLELMSAPAFFWEPTRANQGSKVRRQAHAQSTWLLMAISLPIPISFRSHQANILKMITN